MYRLFAVLLLSTLAFSQAAKPAPKPPSLPSAPGAKPATSKPAAPSAKGGEVAATAPVITIEGVCNGKVPATPSPDCKTVITRAAFDKLVGALDPNMPPPRRQQLAEVYARMLAMSDVAAQRGIENSPATQEVLRFTRMQALTQLLLRAMQQEAANVPPAESQKYYNEHPQQFEQATLLRIFIAKTPPGGEKPPDEKTLQAEADKLRAAAAAGGDFEKLQQQAFDDLALKTPPPPTSAGTQRRESLPAGQQTVFDLQPGQVSEALNEPGGYYIFKVESKKKLTLAEVTPEINRVLESERMKDALDKITNNIKPVFNQEYFGTAGEPGGPGGPAQRRPGGPPVPPAGTAPSGAPSAPPATPPSR